MTPRPTTGLAWRTVRRELLIALAWGAVVSVTAVPFLLPYAFKRSSDGSRSIAVHGEAGPDGHTVSRGPDGSAVVPLTGPEKWFYALESAGVILACAAALGAAVGLAKAWGRGQLRRGACNDLPPAP